MADEIPKHWRNVAANVQFVAEGEQIQIVVDGAGGVSRKAAPCRGLMITSRDGETIFVPTLAGYVNVQEGGRG